MKNSSSSKRHTGATRVQPIEAQNQSDLSPNKGAIFPVVAVGASAGGLEAFSALLANLPGRPGLALVFVQHLDPSHTSAPGGEQRMGVGILGMKERLAQLGGELEIEASERGTIIRAIVPNEKAARSSA